MSGSEIPVARHKAPARGALAGARGDSKAAGDKYDPRGTGTAWSHNFLNQKPWHPSNFKNQARAYEAEQESIAVAKRNALAKQEFEAEQDYMKTLSYLSPEEQKKHAARAAIAFMYQKPPGIDIVERKAAAQAEAAGQGGQAAAGRGGAADGAAAGAEGGGRGRGRGRGPPPPPKEGHVKHMLGAVAALRTDERFELKPGTHGLMGRRSPPRGGQAADGANQQILVSDSDEDAAAMPPPDAAELERQARALLKAEKRAAKAAKEERKRKELEAAEAFLKSAGVDPVDLARLHSKKHKTHKKEKKDRR